MNDRIIQALTIIVLLAVAAAHGGEPRVDLVKARLIADAVAVEPGGTFNIGVLFTIEPQWHIYWINPGDSGIATSVKFTAPPGYEIGELQWPLPRQFESSGLIGYGYERELLLSAEVRVPRDAPPGALTITAAANWLACKTACVPGKARMSLTLPVTSPGSRGEPANAEMIRGFRESRERLPITSEAAESPLSISGSVGDLRIEWRTPVEDVEFYPATGAALALSDIAVHHEGSRTQVTYKPEIYEPAAVPDGTARGLVIFHTPDGIRRGVWVRVKVRP